MDSFFDFLAAGQSTESGHPANTAGCDAATEDNGVILGEVAASEVVELADASHSDSGVIGLCARIEASVAELAAAADVACENVDPEVAPEMLHDAVASIVEEHREQAEVEFAEVSVPRLEPELEATAGADTTSEISITEPGTIQICRVVAEAVEPADTAESQSVAVVVAEAEVPHSEPEARGTEAAAMPIAANINVAESVQEDAAAMVEGDSTEASKVVPIKLKRRVWPQRLAACASVLLIAAASVVVAMPELVWIYI